jgi:hypothetical protein
MRRVRVSLVGVTGLRREVMTILPEKVNLNDAGSLSPPCCIRHFQSRSRFNRLSVQGRVEKEKSRVMITRDSPVELRLSTNDFAERRDLFLDLLLVSCDHDGHFLWPKIFDGDLLNLCRSNGVNILDIVLEITVR